MRHDSLHGHFLRASHVTRGSRYYLLPSIYWYYLLPNTVAVVTTLTRVLPKSEIITNEDYDFREGQTGPAAGTAGQYTKKDQTICTLSYIHVFDLRLCTCTLSAWYMICLPVVSIQAIKLYF